MHRSTHTSKALLAELMRHGGVCLAVVDEAGDVLQTNPPLCTLLGHPEATLHGLPFATLLHPEDATVHAPAFAALLAGTQEHFSAEVRLRHAEGHDVWGIVAMNRLNMPWTGEEAAALSREPRAFVSIQNITPLPLAVAQLKLAVDQLARRNQELEDYTYVVSHHLREPLRGIFNYLSIMQDDHGPTLSGDGQAIMARLLQLARRLDGQFQSLLSLSRAGHTPLPETRTNMCRLATEAVDNLAALITGRNAQVRICQGMPEAMCDPLAVAELWQILIGNALRYTDQSEGIVEIGAVDGTPPVYYVKDTGIGIPKEEQETVFHLFRRLHPRQYGEGSGAGLAIAKKIVMRHGGRIWVESAPGQGSTFYFTLSGGEDARSASTV